MKTTNGWTVERKTRSGNSVVCILDATGHELLSYTLSGIGLSYTDDYILRCAVDGLAEAEKKRVAYSKMNTLEFVRSQEF